MHDDKLIHFYSVNDLHSPLVSCLTEPEKYEEESVQPFGLKMRSNETGGSSEIIEKVEQLDVLDNQAAKGNLKEKENKMPPIGTNFIRICEKFRSKSEPLLYFKVKKESKSMIEKTRNSIKGVPSFTPKGIKKYNMWTRPLCSGFSLETKSEKSNKKGAKFSHNSIFFLGVE